LRCDGVRAPEYGSGSGLSSHASARNPPHFPEGKWEAEGQGRRGKGWTRRKEALDKPEGDARRKENAYKSAVSEELDIMLLANICHAVERPSVNQRELYHNESVNIRVFF